MKRSRSAERYLRQRGEHWHYYRRVPKKYERYDDRGTIRLALGTTLQETARIRRDELAAADDAYWAAMALAGAGGEGSRALAFQRYEAARTAALDSGFRYRPMAQMVAEQDIEDLVRRLLAVDAQGRSQGQLQPRKIEALLGGVEEPGVTVSEALDLYLREIAIDDQYGKSDAQTYQWRRVKRLSIRYFIEQVGDLKLSEITREHALKYHRYWSGRVSGAHGDGKAAKPNTANRHLGNMRLLYSACYKRVGEENRQNPFRNLFFKAKSRTDVPAFPDDWVRHRILAPGALIGIRAELQLITYLLIETGCRPSEIISLQPGDIRMDAEIPCISIRPREAREIRTEASIRDIPLVGVALEAARRAPEGFPHYHDRSELFSANMMKAFRARGLFPTPEHVIYSFRHAFEQRMQEANINYGLRCLLMGHRNTRPSYGDGGSMAYRRDELLKIAHPFSPNVFSRIDEAFPDRAPSLGGRAT